MHWILYGDGRTVFHLDMRHTLFLGPKVIVFVEHLKFFHKAFSVFSSLFSSCKQLFNDFPKQKRILLTSRQTNASNTKQTICVAWLKQQFGQCFFYPYTKKVPWPFPPRISNLFFLLTSQKNKILRSCSWLDRLSPPILEIIQFTSFTVRKTFSICTTRWLIQRT